MDRTLTRLHAHEMTSRLRSGELAATELLEAHLALIDEQDRAIHAWLAVDAAGLSGLVERAQRIQRGRVVVLPRDLLGREPVREPGRELEGGRVHLRHRAHLHVALGLARP